MCPPNDPIAQKAVSFIKNAEGFRAIIQESIEGKSDMLTNGVINDFANKYFYMPQDSSTISQKVEEFIKFYIKN